MSAARPKTLGAAFAPVFLAGCMAFADGVFDALRVAACLVGAVIIQLGTNFANDYFDFVKGADTEDRVGPVRATAAGWVTPGQMLAATLLTFAAITPIAIYLVGIAGWPILVIGIVSLICGIAYTGGPYPLAYIGLGDVFVLVFFGPVAVAGTYYTQALAVPPEVLVAGFIPGLLSTALLAINNLRDVHTDVVANKRTLAVRFGETFARVEVTVCLLVPIAVLPVALVVATGAHWGALASLLALVPAASILRRTWTQDGAALIPVLADIGKVLILQSVLFGIGWALT